MLLEIALEVLPLELLLMELRSEQLQLTALSLLLQIQDDLRPKTCSSEGLTCDH